MENDFGLPIIFGAVLAGAWLWPRRKAIVTGVRSRIRHAYAWARKQTCAGLIDTAICRIEAFHKEQERAILNPLPNPFDAIERQRRWAKIEEVRPTFEGSGRVKCEWRP